MIVLADTHTLIWWLTEPSLLGDTARKDLRAAHDDTAGGILVSVATRIDLHYLAAKGKLAREVIRAVWDVVDSPDTNVRPVPVTAAIAERFGDPALAGGLPDPWDRLIVATAIDLDVALVTKDRAIHALGAQHLVTVSW
jgi:PIN domain nuclease of toxin-antitoxin system